MSGGLGPFYVLFFGKWSPVCVLWPGWTQGFIHILDAKMGVDPKCLFFFNYGTGGILDPDTFRMRSRVLIIFPYPLLPSMKLFNATRVLQIFRKRRKKRFPYYNPPISNYRVQRNG